jgi:hypothetical protein
MIKIDADLAEQWDAHGHMHFPVVCPEMGVPEKILVFRIMEDYGTRTERQVNSGKGER